MGSETEGRILEIVSEVAMKNVSLDDRLIDSNLIDSIAAVDLALRIETEFRCQIAPQEIAEHMQTARALVTYVLRCQ
jgi:D-alanine--poly(phosphoribitol) ligase subunit 2